MAHITLRPDPDRAGATQLIINGIDYSMETYADDVQIVHVGDGPDAEVGLRVTFAVSRLDLGDDQDVQVTGRLSDVAQRVHALTVGADQ